MLRALTKSAANFTSSAADPSTAFRTSLRVAAALARSEAKVHPAKLRV
jgi:hypothetical protein